MNVCGIGINDRKYPSRIGKEKTLEYSHWQKMLSRCFDSSSESNKTYLDCEVSENFKNYSYFYEWCQEQVGFKNRSFHLDKDLLIKGNKIYSEETCVFVPMELNNIVLSSKSTRGKYPIGVSFNKTHGRFESYITMECKRVGLGMYDNELDAFKKYKEAKEAYFKYMAEKYKNEIDYRLYTSLINRVVDIND